MLLRPILKRLAVLVLLLPTACQEPSMSASSAMPAPAAAPQFQAAIAAGKADYAALLARAKQNDPQLDFFALRMSYATTPAFDPTNFLAPFREGHRELGNGDFAGVLAKALPQLERNYTDSWAHFLAAESYRGLGKTTEAEHHRYMVQGLRQSLTAQHLGRSVEDAIVVISVTEEYVVTLSLGYLPQGQSLVRRHGVAYDQIRGRHQGTGEDATLYFIANIPLSSYSAAMQRERPSGQTR